LRVHLIKRQSIEDFVLKNAQSKTAFANWLAIIKIADWTKPSDMTNTINSADILGESSNRVVFNIAGNRYRLICKYHFGKSRVHLFVKWIGTHSAYAQLCNSMKQYSVNAY